MFGRPRAGPNPLGLVTASTGEPERAYDGDRRSTARPSLSGAVASGNDSSQGVGLVAMERDAAAFFLTRSVGVAITAGIIDAAMHGGGFGEALQFGALAALADSTGTALIVQNFAEPLWEKKLDSAYFNAPHFIGGGLSMLAFAYILGQRGNALLMTAAMGGFASASGSLITKALVNMISPPGKK